MNDTTEKMEERRIHAAEETNKIGLEHMLSTFGWSGSRAIPEEMIISSVRPYAKGYKFCEEQVLNQFFSACKVMIDEERAEVERLAQEAAQRLAEAEAAVKANKKVNETEASVLLEEFLTKQTAVQRDEEKAAQIATNRARAEKRLRDRERFELIGSSVSTRVRPKREIKSRLVEVNGYMVLKENQYTMEEGMKTFSSAIKTPKDKKTPSTAYGLFAKEEFKRIRESQPGIDFPSLQKLVASKWKDMDEAAKAPYHEQANAEKERIYAERLASGKNSPEIAVPPEITAPSDPGLSRTPTLEMNDDDDVSREGLEAQDTINSALQSQTTLLSQSTLNGSVLTPEDTLNESTLEKDEDDDDDDDEDEDDAEEERSGNKKQKIDENSSDGAETPVPTTLEPRSKIGGKLPRPTLEEIVDCAIIAIGPRSGCSTEEIENWILTSPLGKRLKDRLKIQYDQKLF